jgi:hypothetical protein
MAVKLLCSLDIRTDVCILRFVVMAGFGVEAPASDPCLTDLLAAIDRYRQRPPGTRSAEEVALDMI